MEIRDDIQLEKIILNELKKSFANIANEINLKLWKNISNKIYDKNPSPYYDRT